MNKLELVQSLATKLEVSQTEAKNILVTFEESIKEGLHADGEVPFLDGKFKVADVKAQPAKERRNPSTGETFMAEAKPESHKVVFKAGKKLKEEFK